MQQVNWIDILCSYGTELFLFSDVDECENSPCHSKANCTNTYTSFSCNCVLGFTGNGTICTGKFGLGGLHDHALKVKHCSLARSIFYSNLSHDF